MKALCAFSRLTWQADFIPSTPGRVCVGQCESEKTRSAYCHCGTYVEPGERWYNIPHTYIICHRALAGEKIGTFLVLITVIPLPAPEQGLPMFRPQYCYTITSYNVPTQRGYHAWLSEITWNGPCFPPIPPPLPPTPKEESMNRFSPKI